MRKPNSIDEVLFEAIEVTTVNGEPFRPADSARMFALIYKRFGQDLDATVAAIGRLLQNSPGDTQAAQLVYKERVARLVAAGLALLNDDRYSYVESVRTDESREIDFQYFVRKVFGGE